MLGVHPETKEKRKRGRRGVKGERGGARWKNSVHLTSAHMCFSHATMPCCCVRSASMCMLMRGNLTPGISCHHHHDELFVCQCVLQPAIPLCVCVCVWQRARQCRQQEEHTRPKKKTRERVCVCEEEKGNSQPNVPTKSSNERACACEEEMRKKRIDC